MRDRDEPEAAVLGRRTVLWLALGLAAAPAVVLGLNRFAYALLLPGMAADLELSYAAAGSLNTANGLGYLFGALATGRLARRYGERRCLTGALVVCVAGLALTATGFSLPVLLALRAVTGLAGAVAFVAGAGLAARLPGDWLARGGGPLALYAAGAGFGVALSAAVVPAVLARGQEAWRLGWVLIALVAAILLPLAASAGRRVRAEQRVPAGGEPAVLRQLRPLLVTYGLFGFGYIAYMTFVVALWRAEGVSGGGVTALWLVLGVASRAAPLLWAPVHRAVTGPRLPAAALTWSPSVRRCPWSAGT